MTILAFELMQARYQLSYKILQCFVSQLIVSLDRYLMSPGSDLRTVTIIFIKGYSAIIFFISTP